jgi:aminoglycoside phosphotransferase
VNADPTLRRLRSAYPGHAWEPVTTGQSGAGVWRLRGRPDLYVKVALPSPHPDSGFHLDAEADRLRWLAGTALPVPRLIDHATTVDGVAYLVTTAVAGRSAAVDWPPERRSAVVDALADVARTLHAHPPAACPFDRSLAVTLAHARAAVAAGLVDLDDLDEVRRGWTAEQLLSTLDSTRPAGEDIVVCHGDLSLANVLLDPDTSRVTGVVDVGRLGRHGTARRSPNGS